MAPPAKAGNTLLTKQIGEALSTHHPERLQPVARPCIPERNGLPGYIAVNDHPAPAIVVRSRSGLTHALQFFPRDRTGCQSPAPGQPPAVLFCSALNRNEQ